MPSWLRQRGHVINLNHVASARWEPGIRRRLALLDERGSEIGTARSPDELSGFWPATDPQGRPVYINPRHVAFIRNGTAYGSRGRIGDVAAPDSLFDHDNAAPAAKPE